MPTPPDPAPPTTADPIPDWLAGLAARGPAPGGGAAAGVVLAAGCALVAMAARYSDLDDLAERADALRGDALGLADADALASAGFSSASREEDAEARSAAVRRASAVAAGASVAIGDVAITAAGLVRRLVGDVAQAVLADAAVAAICIRAALQAAATNTGVDLRAIAELDDDPDRLRVEHADLLSDLDRIERAVAALDALSAQVRPTLRPSTSHA